MRLALVIFFIWLNQTLLVASIEKENQLFRRIQAHLTLNDYPQAVQEAEQALILYPHSQCIHESYIQALSKAGNEKKVSLAWESYVELFPEQAMNRELIEDIAWGVLYKASYSSSIIMRQMALLAAFFSQDAKGIKILKEGMKDSNYAIRAIAAKLGGQYRDYQLIEEIKRLFKNEKVWIVRQQVIESIGNMKILDLRKDLELLIASDHISTEEKSCAIHALLELLETVNRSEIEYLVRSHRYGLRQLACETIAYFQSKRDLDQLLYLTEDPHPGVRLAAFQAIGQIRPVDDIKSIIKLAQKGSYDLNYHVALSATWLLTLYSPHEGQKRFLDFLNQKRREVQILASIALASTGKYGIELTLNQYRQHHNPDVRLNLALGLINHRQSVEEVAHYLCERLKTDQTKWQTTEVGIFKGISNHSLLHSKDVLNTPESDNQILRLEVLNILAILQTPGIQQAIREYLSERSWEISASAAALLLTEGDENAIELVQNLLQDPLSRIRLKAALVLSLWSREEKAIQILEKEYELSDWELKAKILEALGRIGSTQSIPFLINHLKESSQTLRLISAMALIQCLNH